MKFKLEIDCDNAAFHDPDYDPEERRCQECGDPMFIDSLGVSFHGTAMRPDHDADADHTAVEDERGEEAHNDALNSEVERILRYNADAIDVRIHRPQRPLFIFDANGNTVGKAWFEE